MSSFQAVDETLPPGWVVRDSRSQPGRKCYLNLATGKRQFGRPSISSYLSPTRAAVDSSRSRDSASSSANKTSKIPRLLTGKTVTISKSIRSGGTPTPVASSPSKSSPQPTRKPRTETDSILRATKRVRLVDSASSPKPSPISTEVCSVEEANDSLGLEEKSIGPQRARILKASTNALVKTIQTTNPPLSADSSSVGSPSSKRPAGHEGLSPERSRSTPSSKAKSYPLDGANKRLKEAVATWDPEDVYGERVVMHPAQKQIAPRLMMNSSLRRLLLSSVQLKEQSLQVKRGSCVMFSAQGDAARADDVASDRLIGLVTEIWASSSLSGERGAQIEFVIHRLCKTTDLGQEAIPSLALLAEESTVVGASRILEVKKLAFETKMRRYSDFSCFHLYTKTDRKLRDIKQISSFFPKDLVQELLPGLIQAEEEEAASHSEKYRIKAAVPEPKHRIPAAPLVNRAIALFDILTPSTWTAESVDWNT